MGTALFARNRQTSGTGFHSINVPSEWELVNGDIHNVIATIDVSIQLTSPASGNSQGENGQVVVINKFPFN